MTTFPLNVLYGLWCGGCLAACTAPRVVPKSLSWGRLLKLPLLFAILSVVPAAMGMAGLFPDWSLMYLVDSQRLPRLWIVAAGLLVGAGVPLGFALGIVGFGRYGARALGGALAGLLSGYVGLGVGGWRSSRLALIGSYADFHAGGWLMQPVLGLTGEPEVRPAGLLYALLATNLGVGIALVLVARTLLTKSEFIFAEVPKNIASAPDATPTRAPATSSAKASNHWQS